MILLGSKLEERTGISTRGQEFLRENSAYYAAKGRLRRDADTLAASGARVNTFATVTFSVALFAVESFFEGSARLTSFNLNRFARRSAQGVFMRKFNVGVIGATGMVGQRFLLLLQNHPWFNVVCLAASKNSAGKKYKDAIKLWQLTEPMPEKFADMVVLDAAADLRKIASSVDFCFCAVNMPKSEIRALEEAYAKAECPIVSNNSAHRFTDDVPMIIPEVNPEHLEVIASQRKRLNTKRGFIAVKSNCSLQSYVPLLHPLKKFGVECAAVCTYQAVSGAGKTFATMPEIIDNVIPYIGGEEEKSEKEPLKIWGKVENGRIVCADSPSITAQCLRVPVSDGHTAAVFVKFAHKPAKEEILKAWEQFSGEPQALSLPSAPEKFIHYFEEADRPQPKLDRNTERGMAVCAGRLREDNLFNYKFIGFSHNTLRGAAGGAVLLAELLAAKGYFD